MTVFKKYSKYEASHQKLPLGPFMIEEKNFLLVKLK